MNEPQTPPQDDFAVDDPDQANSALQEKLRDAMTPGYQVEFDPDEAEQIGAFVEDALSELDAIDSDIDLITKPTGTAGQ